MSAEVAPTGDAAGAVRPAAAWVRAAALDDVPPGGVLGVTVAGRRLVLCRTGGRITALSGDCTHAAGPLGEGVVAAGCVLECPWHGARFDTRTGAVVRGPARRRLPAYPVRVVDGQVEVDPGARRA